jgi:hypothetical protein
MFEDIEDDFMDEDFDDFEEMDETPPEEGNNRTFLIAAGAIGLVIILGIVCVGIMILRNNANGGTRAQQETEQAQAFADQTQVVLAAQQTAEAAAWTATPMATDIPTETPVPTDVVALPTMTPESLGDATQDPRTATIQALLTEAAAQLTQTPAPLGSITPLPTALPQTGFADDFGVPGLLLLAFFALVVIFLARRLRAASA